MSKAIDYLNVHAVMSTMLKGNGFDASLIGRSISTLSAATAKTDVRAHATAMAILYRSNDAFDCSLAVSLVGALGKGGRANAMVAWFHRHTNIRFTSAKGNLKASLLNADKHPAMYRELTAELIEAARLDPYWAKPSMEGTAKVLTDDSFVNRLASLLAAFEKDDSDVHNADNVVLIDAMRRRVAAHTSAKNLAAVQAMGTGSWGQQASA